MDAANQTPASLDDLKTVDELVKKHSRLITKNALQWQLRRRHENGLASACVPLGHRLLISESRYAAWLLSRAGA